LVKSAELNGVESNMDESKMNNRQWSDHNVGGAHGSESEFEARLDDLFHTYRAACPDPEPSVNFMPEMWAKIEARQSSSTVFNRMAKALVTAALGASVIMALLSSSYSQPASPAYEGTYIQALAADRVSDLEPLQVERISELEQ
jgi:hypothetical protein